MRYKNVLKEQKVVLRISGNGWPQKSVKGVKANNEKI